MVTIKPVELSIEQRIKLVEMINYFYPQYLTVELNGACCDYCLDETLTLSEKAKPSHNDWVLIHWFEFCLLHLPTKIRTVNYEEFGDAIVSGTLNPIDYLFVGYKSYLRFYHKS